ncbi:hypothetical protein ACP275_08G076300 [Erythranthe tilingii]
MQKPRTPPPPPPSSSSSTFKQKPQPSTVCFFTSHSAKHSIIHLITTKMSKRSLFSGGPLSALCLLSAILFLITISAAGAAAHAEEGVRASGFLVKKEKRTTVVSTEYGEISAARATDNINGSYLLHFFTLDPNSLFLPVILHADMVFYVHTGSGKLSWTEEDELRTTDLIRGDVYRLEEGAVFFLQSNLETTKTERQKLRIHAIFTDPNNGLHEPITGPYSSIRDMVLGFDSKVLQAAFNVPAEVIDEILNGTKPPAIIHGVTKTKKSTSSWEVETQFVRALLRSNVYNYNIFETNKKKKKTSVKLFNLFRESKDFENCNGWSTTVTRKKLSALKGSNIGLFMVNLTTGSMMGPHWNPTATEVAVVLQGRGMVRVVCASVSNETECKNRRFEVEEGDVFVVPRFHPMAQMAFNNGTLVFMGFSSSAKRNHPQYLAGQASVFRTLDRDVLALAFDVSNTTLDQLVGPQKESVILSCVSCAEEELRIVEEEREKERERKEEEAKERERKEEEAKEREKERKREEEEAAKKKEEERQKREEEEAAAAAKKKKEEEEEARREEEERERREEEEAEAAAKEEEERKREEEEAKRKEKEEAARREEEERERREREEKEAKRREEEERQEREEEEAREREQEQEEEEARERRKREKAREREEEERREDEEERRRHQEEEAKRREEEEQGGGGRGGQSEGERAAEEERRREEETKGRNKNKEKGKERKKKEVMNGEQCLSNSSIVAISIL